MVGPGHAAVALCVRLSRVTPGTAENLSADYLAHDDDDGKTNADTPETDTPETDTPGTAAPGLGEVPEPAAAAPRRARATTADAAGAAAVDLARAAAVAAAGPAGAGEVGEHLGVTASGERTVVHSFACLHPGYRGWVWSVQLARAARAKVVTVDEAVLLPGPGALLPPDWLPWGERVRAGDLGVGDVLGAAAGDQRLVATWFSGDASAPPDVAAELDVFTAGLGRARVLSVEGRAQAAERWYDGAAGPQAPLAQAAPAHCASCGFFVALRGGLGAAFGACANEMAPDDGRVVAVDHGCGAHSEATPPPSTAVAAGGDLAVAPSTPADLLFESVDELDLDRLPAGHTAAAEQPTSDGEPA